MYRGFNLELKWYDATYYQIGKKQYDGINSDVEKKLSTYISPDGYIDGSKMQEDWFPQVNVDIFISHSHNDKDKAISLAGWLYKKFKLTSFIDSSIWDYSDNLLKDIDNNYCKYTNNGITWYDYKERNQSTSHVHMMLSTALSKMIDKTECLFFLNTPSSITPSDVIAKTESPWIYYELSIAKLLENKIPTRRLEEKDKLFSETQLLEKAVKAKYTTDLSF